MKAYSLGLYEKAMPDTVGWKEKFQAAQTAGYDFVEMSIDESDAKLKRLDMSEEEGASLREIMRQTGIPIKTMCLSAHRKYPMGSSNETRNRKSMLILKKAIRLAEDLGITIIQLAGYDVYYETSNEDTIRRFEKNLNEAVHEAARSGILLGFETMETEFLNTVEKVMVYVQKEKSPYLGIYPDIGNMTNAAKMYGIDVQKDMQSGTGHLLAVHLKETIPGVFREVPFGKGHVDFEGMIRAAWKAGVRKYVTEFWYTKSADWRAELHCARSIMGEILDRMEKGDKK